MLSMRLDHRGFSRSARFGLILPGIIFVAGIAIGAFIAPHWTDRPGISNPALAAVPPAGGLRAGQLADVLHVIDGDTFEARVHVWPGIDITTKVRLRDIDAPELRAHRPEERTQAEAAREGLRTLLAEGEVMVVRVGLDKYGGRVLAGVATRTTPDVSAALLARGLVRPYSGGRREPWCEGA
jgi:endonuclease YncB( thermonuclease family)